MAKLRSLIATALDEGEARTAANISAQIGFIIVILATVLATVFETTDEIAALHGRWLQGIEYLAIAVFIAEYALRLWIAPESAPGGLLHSNQARANYAISVFGVIDLLAILPFIIGAVLAIDPNWLRVLRLLRVLKLARYVPALGLFAAVIRNERRPLLAALMVMLVLLLLNSAIMFALEREAQPKSFASIPHVMWWTIVTMASVGYGDMTPLTTQGKVFGGFVMLLGIAMFAVPAGILATGFAAEIRKRDFVVTWQTVSKLPIFARLDAHQIADIASLLTRQIVPAQYVIVRRGETADSMYFIMSGEVEVDVQPTPLRLGRGQYFGELALLNDTVRMATVTAISDCQLLALAAADFRRLLDAHPDLKNEILQVAEQRRPSGQ